MKKGGFWEYLPEILEELKDGLEPRKLDKRFNKEGVPHDILYRIIRLFETSGLIYKDVDGRYYYVWRKGIRVFSRDNYRIALNHSKQLLLDSEVEISEARLSNLKSERIYRQIKVEKLIENKYFIQHIETGYPEIYELYKNWKNTEKTDEREEAYSLLKDKIRFLIEKIKNGEPLRGYCDLCPMIIVRGD